MGFTYPLRDDFEHFNSIQMSEHGINSLTFVVMGIVYT